MTTNRSAYLTFRRGSDNRLANLSVSDTVVFSSASVSAISQEIRRRGITLVYLESGASFAIPTTSEALVAVARFPSENDFFIFRLISECAWS